MIAVVSHQVFAPFILDRLQRENSRYANTLEGIRRHGQVMGTASYVTRAELTL